MVRLPAYSQLQIPVVNWASSGATLVIEINLLQLWQNTNWRDTQLLIIYMILSPTCEQQTVYTWMHCSYRQSMAGSR